MSINPTHISRARELRKNQTDAEKTLWFFLRNRRFHNLKFLRQHPIIYQVTQKGPDYYIPDFYCAEKKVVLELDGKIHDFQKEEDEFRDSILKNLGLRILRIKNEEVEKDVTIVLNKLKNFVFE
jgi:very-short-patch-repair endonuclease